MRNPSTAQETHEDIAVNATETHCCPKIAQPTYKESTHCNLCNNDPMKQKHKGLECQTTTYEPMAQWPRKKVSERLAWHNPENKVPNEITLRVGHRAPTNWIAPKRIAPSEKALKKMPP